MIFEPGGRYKSPDEIGTYFQHCYFNTSMTVFDYDVFPTLILAAILGKVLRFAVGVHICAHNRHLYMSVMESLLYMSRHSKHGTYELASLQTNQAGWLRFFLSLSVRVFQQGLLATSVHDEVAVHKMYQP